MSEPVPPGHGEPENVGAIPGDYCLCGYPVWDVKRPGRCPKCGRSLEGGDDAAR
jgi:hypothetical protein